MKTIISMAAATALLCACGGSDDDTPPAPAGVIDQLEVVSTADAYNGATPAGAAGPYSVITGIVHGKLNPSHPDNAGIVDLANAPVDANGYVSYTTDVVILRPKSAANARRVLFYDVVNRGNKLAQNSFVGGGALPTGAAPDASYSLAAALRLHGGLERLARRRRATGNGATGSVGVSFPVATNKDGTPITGLSREEYIQDYAGGTPNVIPLTYAPASLTDKSEVTFTARQSWLNAAGKQDYAAPSVPVTTWSYVTNANGSVSVQFTPPAAVPTPSGASVPPDAGTIYSFVYRAKDPVVMGIGFAAVRDLVSYLRTGTADAKGTANPLNDMKQAACAAGTNCPASPTTNFDVAIGEGISQSGRFMRDFLYQGFNKDANGNKVFDGMMPNIPASRKHLGQLALRAGRPLVQAARGPLDAGRSVPVHLRDAHRSGQRQDRRPDEELPRQQHLPEDHAARRQLRVVGRTRVARRHRRRRPRHHLARQRPLLPRLRHPARRRQRRDHRDHHRAGGGCDVPVRVQSGVPDGRSSVP